LKLNIFARLPAMASNDPAMWPRLQFDSMKARI